MRHVTPGPRFASGALCLPVTLCLLWFVTSSEGEVRPSASEERITSPPSREASKWLAIAEDETKDIQDRITAVYELEQLKEGPTADRLVKLLPGDYDALSFRIVEALGAIRSPRALPALKKMYNQQKITVPGKLRVALKDAIRNCGGDLKNPK